MTNSPRFWEKTLLAIRKADWEAVYRTELPRIYNYFRYHVGDARLAEDLTAETFEKAWKNRHQYRNDLSAFSTWLFTIARNLASDYFRRARDEVSLENAVNVSDDEPLESLVQRRSDIEKLSMLLGQLSDRDRELVALKYGAGLTNRKIAQLQGISESNVGTILHRVMQQLRTAWEKRS
ncbi:MAG: RNA polymerase sigma factor [Anaerolineales bacterium]|nr:RNA polymerase sigma factor [Anaerolineales bacterium]